MDKKSILAELLKMKSMIGSIEKMLSGSNEEMEGEDVTEAEEPDEMEAAEESAPASNGKKSAIVAMLKKKAY